jgi:ATP-dependent Lhr-like helicase
MRRVLPESVLQEVGRLDPAAIARVQEEAWPDVRDADELHDVLQTLIALPEDYVPAAEVAGEDPVASRSASEEQSGNGHFGLQGVATDPKFDPEPQPGGDEGQVGRAWRAYLEPLLASGRAGVALHGGRKFLLATERAKTFAQIYPEATFQTALPDIESPALSADDALLATVTGWMGHSGPTTAAQLGEILGQRASEIDKSLLRLEASGAILRGKFTSSQSDIIEWCDRRLLARIHRLTLGTLRKQIEPVTAAQFMRWLLRWQHVTPGAQALGERGTLEVLHQLQGFEIPASAWERQILARRIADYDPAVLDQLCLTGAVGWGRLSPHPATLHVGQPRTANAAAAETANAPDRPENGRRVIPTSVAPITFYIRAEADWMSAHANDGGGRGLSQGARHVLDFLRQRGASFFADIVRGTGKLKAEIETALWELVAAGLVTADGFDNLRALIDPKRRSGQGHGRMARPRHSAGRWSLLYTSEPAERSRMAEAACWMLLRRYGVVFRDLLAREAIVPKWRELVIAFRRLEDRGEVRGGRFVSGFLGEQFGLPVAVESLRAMRNLAPAGETITISAADPLNLVGIIVPGERVPAISGRTVSFRDGVACLSEDAPVISSAPIPMRAATGD